jgi:SAM-dependent methyltransferase
VLVINLGCGTKTSSHTDVVNVDWSPYLRLRSHTATRVLAPVLLRGERRTKFKSLPDNIVVKNLAKGIPFADSTVDLVYSSHFLEHLDREVAPKFLHEVLRVLRPGGITRVVVPDLEHSVRSYLESLEAASLNGTRSLSHDERVADLYEQSVRRKGAGAASRAPLAWIERVAVGDARRRGETHQWMYDRVNLPALLERSGFVDVKVMSWNSSGNALWPDYGLETNADGSEYKRNSLYVEAARPA